MGKALYKAWMARCPTAGADSDIIPLQDSSAIITVSITLDWAADNPLDASELVTGGRTMAARIEAGADP